MTIIQVRPTVLLFSYRRIRLNTHDTVNDLSRRVLELGDLKFAESRANRDPDDTTTMDFSSRSSGLARSKSDHRLVADFRRRGDDMDVSPPVRRRRFGESRYAREENKSRTNFGRFGDDDDEEDGGGGGTGGAGRTNRFRSRFLRADEDDDGYYSQS